MHIRSLLFVPGNSEKLIAKGEIVDADVIIYDLEDAVSLEDKKAARETVQQALANSKKSVFVRVNSIDTSYFADDVRAVVQTEAGSLKGIMLPKANRSVDVHTLDSMLNELDASDSVEIVPLLETAIGVHHAYEIAGSSNRVKRMAFGSVDFGLDIQATLTKEGTELLFARSQIVIASRAQNLQQPIDTVYIDFKDTEGLIEETRMAKGLGFGSKLAIHPAQLQGINDTFSPSEEEIKEANRIMSIVNEQGSSVFQIDGKMVDEPIIKRARRIQDQAELLN